jgi:AhpD family alkylhydroperoxidase
MPLINLIDHRSAPLLLRDLFSDGDPGPIVGALAQVPELCERTLPFLSAALGASSVSVRRKEIAIVRTSADLHCRYCTDTHTVVGAESGLSIDELRALRGEIAVRGVFSDDAELALIAWVDAIATGRGPLDPLTAARARVLLGDQQLVELTVTVGATMLLNRFATAFDLPVSAATREGVSDLGLCPFAPSVPTLEEVPA